VSNKTGYCLAEVGKQYLVYLPPRVGQCQRSSDTTYKVTWINAQNPTDQRSAGTTSNGQGLMQTKVMIGYYTWFRGGSVANPTNRAAIAESQREKQMTPIRIEAEDMTTTYRTESGSLASGRKLISLRNAAGPMGSASTAFTEGSYNVVLGYYDENDGVSHLKVSVGDVRLDKWSLNQNLGSAKALKIWCAPLLPLGYHSTGTAIEIQGTANQAGGHRLTTSNSSRGEQRKVLTLPRL